MQTFLALVKNSGSLIRTSGLHCVIFKFWMLTDRAWLFDCHFCFPSSFFSSIRMNILSNPVSIFMDHHVTFNRLSNKLFEAKFLFAGRAYNLLKNGV